MARKSVIGDWLGCLMWQVGQVVTVVLEDLYISSFLLSIVISVFPARARMVFKKVPALPATCHTLGWVNHLSPPSPGDAQTGLFLRLSVSPPDSLADRADAFFGILTRRKPCRFGRH